MKYIVFAFITFLIYACSSGPGPVNIDLTGFESISIPGADAQKVVKKDGTGKILEEGFISNGTRNGLWITYHPDADRIKTITNYVDGKVNGYHLQFTNRGQIEFKGQYVNDAYDGRVTKYKFGRELEVYNYQEGDLDGPFTIYTDRGKMQTRGAYKNGKQDGILQYFDEDGNVTLEYEYKNGEKVSGGIVEEKE